MRRRLIEHHQARLDVAEAALSAEPLSAYDVSFPLFGDELKPGARRFAVAETLSHLERLVREGRAVRGEADGVVAYTRPMLTTSVVDDRSSQYRGPGDGA